MLAEVLEVNVHETLMRRFVDDVINKADYGLLGELLHPNYVYRSPEQTLHGSQALEALFTTYRAGLPDLHVAIDDLVASGDRVVIAITLTGTHTGELLGLPATARRLKVHAMVLSRMEDGKIIEEWEILDRLSLFQQLGMVSLPS